VVTTGTFDGVHCGHVEILNKIKDLAQKNGGETVVVTFDPHPRTVIHPDIDIKLLHTIDEKIDRLDKVGIDHFVIIPFTKEFSRTSSLSFVRDILIRELQTKLLVIGYDHQFGRNREGSITDLEEFSRMYDFQIEQIEAQTFEDINISSTKIRKALEEGDIETANVFLGYDFMITGEVIHGLKKGSGIGFPTANIMVPNPHKIIPSTGVYAVEVILDKQMYGGMLNIGVKPTVGDRLERSIEVHIFNFDQDIYGESIQVNFKKRIRSEKKFENMNALGLQLEKDQNAVLEILGL
jgi:riboflavin kinase/FMN adenylyltransferase